MELKRTIWREYEHRREKESWIDEEISSKVRKRIRETIAEREEKDRHNPEEEEKEEEGEERESITRLWWGNQWIEKRLNLRME